MHYCRFALVLSIASVYRPRILIEVQISPEFTRGALPQLPIRALRLQVRAEAYTWLNAAAAIEVNQVWNYCNATSLKAARPFAGKNRWLSGFDLCRLTAGATEHFTIIGADSIQRVCVEFAQRRTQARKARLRWRVSFGSRRSLGWIPFKAASVKRRGKYLRFCGKTIRIFESERFGGLVKWQQGCFAQDAVGDWYFCLLARREDGTEPPQRAEVGLDCGLKDTAVTSDGERLAAVRYHRSLEAKIAQSQRRGHRRQAKRLHRRAARRRQDALHQFSRRIVNRYQLIVMGDVSSLALTKTRMAKSVLDCGWGLLRTQLLYKGEYAGRCVRVVSERNPAVPVRPAGP